MVKTTLRFSTPNEIAPMMSIFSDRGISVRTLGQNDKDVQVVFPDDKLGEVYDLMAIRQSLISEYQITTTVEQYKVLPKRRRLLG